MIYYSGVLNRAVLRVGSSFVHKYYSRVEGPDSDKCTSLKFMIYYCGVLNRAVLRVGSSLVHKY